MVIFGQEYLIYRVEIDVLDSCGIGCTQCFAYGGAAALGADYNDTIAQPEILVMDWGAAGAMVGSLAVSSCEGQVLGNSIRICSEVVADEKTAWGEVKSLCR